MTDVPRKTDLSSKNPDKGGFEKLKQGAEGMAHPESTPEVSDKITATRESVDKAMQSVGVKGQSVVEEKELTPEQAERELDPIKAQYEKMDQVSQARCSWEELVRRIIANNGYNLGLVHGLNNNGVLFGVDKEGNPLFADRGDEPVMTGMNYPDTRNRVLYKYDGEEMVRREGEPVRTGYEMFSYSRGYAKSEEIEMYEKNTGRPFVKSPNGDEMRMSWLESGEYPERPRHALFNPHSGRVGVDHADPGAKGPDRGVRRLLRLRSS